MIYRHINDENGDENDDPMVYNGGDDYDQQVEGNEYRDSDAHYRDSGELFNLIISYCVVS